MTKTHTRQLTRLLIPAVLLMLVSVACSLSGDPDVIVVTATPSDPSLITPPPDSIQPTPIPYITPTPQIVPTPTLPPAQAFDDAEAALHNGDYVTAVSYFDAVINQSNANANLRASALYGKGEAALREGLYDQASEAFSAFLVEYPNDARVPHATFLRGDAHSGLFQWQFAIADYQTYLALRPGIIDSYVHERIGDAYLALGMSDQALTAYTQAANATRELSSLVALKERVAASYLNNGDPAQAVAQYDSILAVAQNSFYRASIEFQAAQVLIDSGDVASGYTRIQRVINQYPASSQAYYALNMALGVDMEIDGYTQAKIYYYNEDYNAAISAINTTISETGSTAELLLWLGESYREIGNTQAAITTFQTVIDTYPEWLGAAWLEQGRTYFLSGDTLSAIQTYSALATQHPEYAEGAEALSRAGYLYSTIGNTDSALATYDILGQMFPGTEQAMDGLYAGATMAYNAGDVGTAASLFGQLAQTGTGELQAAAYLWVGRLYQNEGKTDEARAAYQAAAGSDPGGYYSIRASDLLNGRAPFDPPTSVRFEFDEGVALTEAEAWLRSTFGIEQTGALYPLSAALEADERMIRGRELMIVGASTTAYEAAEVEFDALRTAYQDDPLATYQLAIYFRDLGLYKLSITAAADVIIAAGIDTTQAPSYIARLRYPVYYQDLVLPSAAEYELDPLLVFSLIRQESLYEGFATSWAAAQGLMQIIPSTGEEIAGRLDWPNYQNSDVYRPYINVKFGTFYLRWVLDNFAEGLPYVALAGYNGGPGNAAQWLSISGPDLDLFVQTVGFPETRTYVTRIYEQYNVYRALYGVG
ncbi:MAG: tetratricopeptide repeat protein [Anaerolineae bacterium]|nr:tetratricopeptide repeat protein [Anaerolineae bacterium]